jgi:hypothetical protein
VLAATCLFSFFLFFLSFFLSFHIAFKQLSSFGSFIPKKSNLFRTYFDVVIPFRHYFLIRAFSNWEMKRMLFKTSGFVVSSEVYFAFELLLEYQNSNDLSYYVRRFYEWDSLTFLGFKSFGVERIRFKSDQVRQSLMMKSRRVYRCMLKLYSSTFRMVCNTDVMIVEPPEGIWT